MISTKQLAAILMAGCLLQQESAAQTGVQPLFSGEPAGEQQPVSAKVKVLAKAKVSDELKAKATDGPVAVMILLSEEMPANQLEEVKGRFAAQLRAFHDRLRQATGNRVDVRTLRRETTERDELLRAQRAEMAEFGKRAFFAQQSRMTARIEGMGGKVQRRMFAANVLFATLDAAGLAQLESDPEVLTVEENGLVQKQLVNTTRILGAPDFWAAGFTGGTQTVGVIDSGIAPRHAAFEGVKVSAFAQLDGALATGCAVGNDIDPWDRDGHGTHVAGTIASRGLAEVPELRGVAFGVEELISVKVGIAGTGVGRCPDFLISDGDVLVAAEFLATATAARVVNISLGGNTNADDFLGNWILDRLADTHDVMFVVAAGNSGTSRVLHQVGNYALSYNGIAVANVDNRQTLTRTDDVVAPSSSRGPTPLGRRKPEIGAPGTNVVSLAPGPQGTEVATLNGTSMASPHVAGAVALLFDAGVEGVKEAKAILFNSADGAGWNRSLGYGAADLTAALREKDFVVSGKVAPGAPRYYKYAIDGPARATLVWNRHINGISPDARTFFGDFRNLNLGAYAESNNATVTVSASTIDNVEQLGLTGQGMAILKVSHIGSGSVEEPFALAMSHAGYEAVAGPQVNVSCAGTPEVSATMRVAVQCTARNVGALPMYGVTFRLNAPLGFTALSVPTVAQIRPNEAVNFRYDMNTPANARGAVSYNVTLEGAAFGDTFTARVPLSVNLRAPIPQDCTPVITPANNSLTLTPLAQTFTVRVQFPRYNANEPGFCTYSFSETSAWFTTSGTRSVTGNGEFVVNVSANGTNRLFNSRVGTIRFTFGTQRLDYTFQQLYNR